MPAPVPPCVPQTSSSCRSLSSCRASFRALATTCFLLLRKAFSSAHRSKPRRTARSLGLGQQSVQGSGGTCRAQPLAGQAHNSCQITSPLPTPRSTLPTALPCPTTTPHCPQQMRMSLTSSQPSAVASLLGPNTKARDLAQKVLDPEGNVSIHWGASGFPIFILTCASHRVEATYVGSRNINGQLLPHSHRPQRHSEVPS